MTRVRWTPQAAHHLESIRDFIAEDSPFYARLVIERILAAVDALEAFPCAGRVVPEVRRDTIRELIHGPYRIVYRVEVEDTVRILTVFRASRLFPSVEGIRRVTELQSLEGQEVEVLTPSPQREAHTPGTETTERAGGLPP